MTNDDTSPAWQDAPDDADYATEPGTPLQTFTDEQLRQHDAEVARGAVQVRHAEQGLPSCGFDTEAHAAAHNQGYADAVAQELADDPALASEWLEEQKRAAVVAELRAVADRWPAMLRDMVSRGQVRQWLLAEADRIESDST